MKQFYITLFIAASMVACTRSGSTIANDDSIFRNQQTDTTSQSSRTFNYPLDPKLVPTEVTIAFWERNPDARYVSWYLLRDGNYQVIYALVKLRWTAVYEPNGTLVSETQG